jgi:CrcB protein
LVSAVVWLGAALLGAAGAVARFRLDSAVSSRLPSDFPLGTLMVNLTGAFALGVLIGLAASDRVAFLLGTGFAGGYTTFSTWMVESVRLGELNNVVLLLRNLWLSMLAGFASVAAGFYLAQALT